MNAPNLDPIWLFVAAYLLISMMRGRPWRRERTEWILLPQKRFWEIVARKEKTLVLITMLGFLPKRICYLLPHEGIIFYTWTRPRELPPGAMLIPTNEQFA